MSLGVLVVEAAEALGVKLTPEMAMPLFAAVATDTGWFRFSSTSPGTYRCAAKLMEAGAKPAAIYNSLYEQDTLGRMRLRGLVLTRIAIFGTQRQRLRGQADRAVGQAIQPDGLKSQAGKPDLQEGTES